MPSKNRISDICSCRNILALAASAVFFATGAQANLTISNAATKNVSCSANVCQATTGGDVVLNVTQLQNMLASASVTVDGSLNLNVDAGLSWVSASTLTLNGCSVSIDQPMSVAGSGGLSVETNTSGSCNGRFWFGKKGKVTFWSTSDNLTINGDIYALVNSIPALIAAVGAGGVHGNYALVNDYDASTDGTYSAAPISGVGNFIGLGNTISKLSVIDPVAGHQVGLFGTAGVVSGLHLQKVRIGGADNSQVGGIVGVNEGEIVNDSVEGTISTSKGTNGTGPGAIAGGLAGLNYNYIAYSSSSGKVIGGKNAIIGGAVGEDGINRAEGGELENSYSTASVFLDSGSCKGCSIGNFVNSAGGLVGVNNGQIGNCYATGAVTGDASANVGGLVGLSVSGQYNDAGACYSTGSVSGGPGSSAGGAIGFDQGSDSVAAVYWDTTTSGIANSTQGAGNVTNDPGITGLTTAQLQSGLPPGFNGEDWDQTAGTNNGLPYLRAPK